MNVKKRVLLLMLLCSVFVLLRANTESYTTWTSGGERQVTVRISAPNQNVKIQNGRVRIPLTVSPSYNVAGTMVSVDFIKNGKSMTGGYGMSGLLQKDSRGYYMYGTDLKLYWSSLVDGIYKVIILPEQN